MDSFKYIRDYYGVPVEKGRWVTFCGKRAQIINVSKSMCHLVLAVDGESREVIAHPTWEIEY